MRLLQAIELTPELQTVERNQILVIGSLAVALCKTHVGIPPQQDHIHVDDLDLSVPKPVFMALNSQAVDRTDAQTDVTTWVRNTYRGVHTVRHDVGVPGLSRPVQLDIGTGANGWTHEELLGDAILYNGYSIINPRKQLTWYEILGRKKDQEKIRILRDTIIPAWPSL